MLTQRLCPEQRVICNAVMRALYLEENLTDRSWSAKLVEYVCVCCKRYIYCLISRKAVKRRRQGNWRGEEAHLGWLE